MKKNLKQLAKDIIEADKHRVAHPVTSYNKDFYTIVAYGGDMSATGMGHTAAQIQIPKEDYNLVANYLSFDDDYNYYLKTWFQQAKDPDVDSKELDKKLYKIHQTYLEQMSKYFTHKYFVRSSWAFLEVPEYNFDEETA